MTSHKTSQKYIFALIADNIAAFSTRKADLELYKRMNTCCDREGGGIFI